MKKTILILQLLFTCLSSFAQKFNTDWNKHEFLNKEAPLFTANTLNDESFNLLNFRRKIIVMDFWSFTCALCYKEIPELNLIAKEYKDKDVVVVSLMSESKNEILEKINIIDGNYVLKRKIYGNDLINYQIIPDAKSIMEEYTQDRQGYPFVFIIDKKGILKKFVHGYRGSYGNPKPHETENYKELRNLLDEVIKEN